MASSTAQTDEHSAAREPEATISFAVPEWLIADRQMTAGDFAGAVRMAAAMYWYGRGDLSLEAAAALAGISQSEFMHALRTTGQDTVVIDWDDLDRELSRAGVAPPPSDDVR